MMYSWPYCGVCPSLGCGDKFDHEARPGRTVVCAPNDANANVLLYFHMFSLKFLACSLEPSKKSLDSLRVEEAEPYHCGNSLDLLMGIVVHCNIHSERSFLPGSMHFHSWL